MKQIIAIHGGDEFATYDEYIAALNSCEVELGNSDRKGWKMSLSAQLGFDYQVTLPRMPNASNAKYAEWKLWFEKYASLVEDGVILIGHSLGGIFLAKYLSENRFSKKIGATFLVAPPYDQDGERTIVEFTLPDSLQLLEEQGGELFIYHSKDDPIVAFEELQKYQNALPKANALTFADRGHFLQEEFPELVQDIKGLG
jgi:predicted alpha/beta hydrolase family esterase